MALNIWNLVISDMKHRDELGTAKYGKPLATHDGRRTLQDAYEECLDMAVYLKKAILESQTLCNCGHQKNDHHFEKHGRSACLYDSCECFEYIALEGKGYLGDGFKET